MDWQYSVYKVRGLDSLATAWHIPPLAVGLFVHTAWRVAPVMMRTAPFNMVEEDAKCSPKPCPSSIDNPAAVLYIDLLPLTKDSSLIHGVGVYSWRVLQLNSNSSLSL